MKRALTNLQLVLFFRTARSNETLMAAFASSTGPFAVAVDAGHPLWYNYEVRQVTH